MSTTFILTITGVIFLALAVQIHEIRSFRKWLETRWYSDLKAKEELDKVLESKSKPKARKERSTMYSYDLSEAKRLSSPYEPETGWQSVAWSNWHGIDREKQVYVSKGNPQGYKLLHARKDGE